MAVKTALITGIAGQDGSYLTELLLYKGYEVHGIVRRNSSNEHCDNLLNLEQDIRLHYGDMTDSVNISTIMNKVKPDEVYNLAAQSHVHVSFELPEFTANCNALGTLRILEAVKNLQTEKNVKFYQASTSEMFGQVHETPQTEKTYFYPRSPYGVAKLYAHWMTVNYRESYNLFACSGVLFNHESPRRGETFLTRKITLGLAEYVRGREQTPISLGNLDAKRDWGHARDYVKAMWLMLQQDKPKDYVISTGVQTSVRKFCELACDYYGIVIEWSGTGKTETGRDSHTGDIVFKVDPKYYRPSDVNTLLGDSTLAYNELNWQPTHTIEDLVNEMCAHDDEAAKLRLHYSEC
jgi:GDPmannose 4,6-dehydratase